MPGSRSALTRRRNEIVASVRRASTDPSLPFVDEIEPFRQASAAVAPDDPRTEFLVVLKPELVDIEAGVSVPSILDLVAAQCARFDIAVLGIVVLSASALRDKKIIERQYRTLNQVSLLGARAMPPNSVDALDKALAGRSATLVGGHELLASDPTFSTRSLETLHRNMAKEKLAAGVYAVFPFIDGQQFVLLNGFHPRQIEHFQQPGRTVVGLQCESPRPLHELRARFVGDTDPGRAEAGSTKRLLAESASNLALGRISIAFNGIHMSPGPVEAMLALQLYFPGLSITDTRLGAQLQKSGWTPDAASALGRSIGRRTGVPAATVLEITEDMDARTALQYLAGARASSDLTVVVA